METLPTERPQFVIGFTKEVFGQTNLGFTVDDLSNELQLDETALNNQLKKNGIEIFPSDQFFSDGAAPN